MSPSRCKRARFRCTRSSSTWFAALRSSSIASILGPRPSAQNHPTRPWHPGKSATHEKKRGSRHPCRVPAAPCLAASISMPRPGQTLLGTPMASAPASEDRSTADFSTRCSSPERRCCSNLRSRSSSDTSARSSSLGFAPFELRLRPRRPRKRDAVRVSLSRHMTP